MAALDLFYPVKPIWVNQVFGLFNPAYKQFGFTEHNGVDYQADIGQLAYAMCDGIVVETGFNDGAGNYVKYKTLEPVEAEGRTGVVMFMYMHASSVLVQKGQYVKAGDPLFKCGTTGFSTGPHLHISAFFIDAAGRKIKVGRKETDWCFDFSKYYNRFFAADAQKLFSIYYQLIALLRAQLNK